MKSYKKMLDRKPFLHDMYCALTNDENLLNKCNCSSGVTIRHIIDSELSELEHEIFDLPSYHDLMKYLAVDFEASRLVAFKDNVHELFREMKTIES